MSKQEVDRLVKEAQSHAAEDQQRRELIDARNEADALAYSVEKTLNEHRDRVPAADRSRIESAIQEVRQAAQRDDVSAIKRSIEALQQMSHALAQTVYAQAQHAQGARSGSSAPDVTEGEVIDAEPVESTDRK